MKEEYEKRLYILNQKLDNGISQAEEHITLLRNEIQKSFSYDLAFLSKTWEMLA